MFPNMFPIVVLFLNDSCRVSTQSMPVWSNERWNRFVVLSRAHWMSIGLRFHIYGSCMQQNKSSRQSTNDSLWFVENVRNEPIEQMQRAVDRVAVMTTDYIMITHTCGIHFPISSSSHVERKGKTNYGWKRANLLLPEPILICLRDVLGMGNHRTDLELIRWTDAFQCECIEEDICTPWTRHKGEE